MAITIVLIISILLQFAAAFWAVRLIWVTGRRVAWSFIAAAILLMAIRRCVTLFQGGFSGSINTTTLSAELVALAISILMLIGVVRIAPIFLSLKRSEKELRESRDELERRVQERTLGLKESNRRLEQEITERMKAEEALGESEEQFRRAIEEAPIPTIMQAEDGEVLQISRSWTDLTGYTSEDMKTFDAWLNQAYGEGANEVRNHMRSLFKGDKRSIDICVKRYVACRGVIMFRLLVLYFL